MNKFVTLTGLSEYNSRMPYKNNNKNNIAYSEEEANITGESNFIFGMHNNQVSTSNNILFGNGNELTSSGIVNIGSNNLVSAANAVAIGSNLEISDTGLIIGYNSEDEKNSKIVCQKDKINFDDNWSFVNGNSSQSIFYKDKAEIAFKSGGILAPNFSWIYNSIYGESTSTPFATRKRMAPNGEECYIAYKHSGQVTPFGSFFSPYNAKYILMQALKLKLQFSGVDSSKNSSYKTYEGYSDNPQSTYTTGNCPVGVFSTGYSFIVNYKYSIFEAPIEFYYWVENKDLIVGVPSKLHNFLIRCINGEGEPFLKEYEIDSWGIGKNDGTKQIEEYMSSFNYETGFIFNIGQVNLLSYEICF